MNNQSAIEYKRMIEYYKNRKNDLLKIFNAYHNEPANKVINIQPSNNDFLENRIPVNVSYLLDILEYSEGV